MHIHIHMHMHIPIPLPLPIPIPIPIHIHRVYIYIDLYRTYTYTYIYTYISFYDILCINVTRSLIICIISGASIGATYHIGSSMGGSGWTTIAPGSTQNIGHPPPDIRRPRQ